MNSKNIPCSGHLLLKMLVTISKPGDMSQLPNPITCMYRWGSSLAGHALRLLKTQLHIALFDCLSRKPFWICQCCEDVVCNVLVGDHGGVHRHRLWL